MRNQYNLNLLGFQNRFDNYSKSLQNYTHIPQVGSMFKTKFSDNRLNLNTAQEIWNRTLSFLTERVDIFLI